MLFLNCKEEKYNRCQNYMYVIYSVYMTYQVTKIKMQDMVMQKVFSHNNSAKLDPALSIVCFALEKKTSFSE